MNPTLPFDAILPHFCESGANRTDDVRRAAGVSLPDACLNACVRYYRDRIRRDPTVAELRMLDRLAALPADPLAQPLLRLETSDRAVADTYADFIRKRRELIPDGNAPVLPGELLSAVRRYLARSGKESALPGLPFGLIPPELLALSDDGIPAEGSAFRLVPERSDVRSGVAPGDVFLLIRNRTLTDRAFAEAMRALLEKTEFASGMRRVRYVGADGLLPALLQMTLGISVHLGEADEGKHLPEWLVAHEEGGLLVSLPGDRELYDAFRAELPEGVSVTPVAAATEGYTVSVRFREQTFVWETAFLCTIRSSAVVPVTLREDAGADILLHRPVTQETCRYLRPAGRSSGQIASRGLTASAVHSSVRNSPFRSTVAALLIPVAALASAGHDYTDVRFAIGISVPEDPARLDSVLPALLGIYRAQAELGIPDAVSCVSFSTHDFPSVTAFAVAAGERSLPDRFQKVGSKVYLAGFPFGEDGLPDFPAVRPMLREIASCAADGHVLSARILAGEAVTDALRAMRTDSLFCRLSVQRIASDGPVPMALLLESDTELPFAQIGETAIPETAEQDDSLLSYTDLFSWGKGLIWQSAPEAVILAAPDDPDAPALARFLESKGAAIHLCTGKDVGPFSRALLTANILLVCTGASLPQDPRVAFACEVMRKNGGRILSLGSPDALGESTPHIHLPRGIARA